jgi:hypothetical protein
MMKSDTAVTGPLPLPPAVQPSHEDIASRAFEL